MVDDNALIAASRVLEVCASVFRYTGLDSAVADLKAVAKELDFEVSADGSSDDLAQRYADRLIVPNSPFYCPITENSVAYHKEYGSFGPVCGKRSDEVARVYEAAGFDHAALIDSSLSRTVIRVDSVPSECAFLAALLSSIAGESDESVRARRLEFAKRFYRLHFSQWVGYLASLMEAKGGDVFSDSVLLASEVGRLVFDDSDSERAGDASGVR